MELYDGSGVSAKEGAVEANKAVALLATAVGMGYRSPDAYRTESALDRLRNRADLSLGVIDLVPYMHSGA